MTTIKIYENQQFYRSKYGDKCFIENDDSGTYLAAAMLTGKGLESEEQLIYAAYGNDEQEAQAAVDNYIKATKFKGTISRTEIINI